MPFCSKCGANVQEGSGFCNACGQPTPGFTATQAAAAPTMPVAGVPNAGVPNVPAYVPPGGAVWQPVPQVAYAGFWLRFVAWFIDWIILVFVGGIVMVPFGGMHLHRMLMGHPPSPQEWFGAGGMHFHGFVVTQILHWIYYAILESSVWQGTLGKKVLGLEVTDLAGARVSFGRATGRFAGRYVSMLTLGIGYIMAGITQKKQALHDIIAGTLVIRKI
jgi:uncharacterized RDD family membrane protein YckC